MCLRGGATGIDYHHSFGFTLGDGKVSASDASEERSALLLETVLIYRLGGMIARCSIPAPCALHAGGNFRIHQNGEIRLQVAAQNTMKLQHRFAAQFAAASLVGFRRIGETVAKHNFPRSQSWLNHLFNVLRAGTKHERQLGKRRQVRRTGMEKYLTNFFADVRSARFARDNYLETLRPQYLCKFLQLRALARPVQTLDGDELSAMGHGEIIAFSRQRAV